MQNQKLSLIRPGTGYEPRPPLYSVTTIVDGTPLTPREVQLLEIIRTSPAIKNVLEIMGVVDSDTRKNIFRMVFRKRNSCTNC